MERLFIKGGERLRGEVSVHGAKNSSLPILAATLLSGGETVLHNCPKLSDVDAAIEILLHLGCRVKREAGTGTVIVNSDSANVSAIPQKLMHEMRSSIVFLGAIISRMGQAALSFPGGCELGPRPIDLHISALKKLGAVISEEYGCLNCTTPNGLRGAKINLSFPSVGATENIMLASVTATGETIIHNAAQEPEIVDLANYLISRGARIEGAGKSVVTVQGVESLHSTEYWVMPDRIVAATYLAAAAITGGSVRVTNIVPSDMESIFPILEQSGAILSIEKDAILINGPTLIKPVKEIRTMPYPGFPTDAQAPIMALLTMGSGTSVFIENIFESRYKHAGELARMGADIRVEGRAAIVRGVPMLYGADVEATDLRGGAALCVAALAAMGETRIQNIFHIDRGYEQIEKSLSSLGANIARVR